MGNGQIRDTARVNRVCNAVFYMQDGCCVNDLEARVLTVSEWGFRISSSMKSDACAGVIISFPDGEAKTIALLADKVEIQPFVTDKNQCVYDCKFPGECVTAKNFLKKRSRSHRKTPYRKAEDQTACEA